MHLGDRWGIPTVALRYSIVQGPGQSPRNAYSGVLRRFVQQVLAGEPPTLYEDGRQQRDYVHIDDVVQANLKALVQDCTGQSLNIGGWEVSSVREYACLVLSAQGGVFNGQVSGLYRVGDSRHAVSCNEKARRYLEWGPINSHYGIVADYLAWYQQHYAAAPAACPSRIDQELKIQGSLRGSRQTSDVRCQGDQGEKSVLKSEV